MSAAAEHIWERIVGPQEADLSPDVARYFLSLGFTQAEKQRYAELAKLEHYEIGPDEKSELDMLIAANTFLMLVQAKARLSLNRQQPAA
jgi:hypothetical protein